jgi:hypothetical protein
LEKLGIASVILELPRDSVADAWKHNEGAIPDAIA